jgi:hypothetical protein
MTRLLRSSVAAVGVAVTVAAVLGSSVSAQEQRVNVRGVIAAVDGKTLTVKTKAADDVVIELPETVAVSTTKAFSLADVKPGMILGVTTLKRPDGSIVAIDVRPIPPQAPLGLSPWDLAPDATMTNAVVEGTVASANGQELTLNYKSGTVKALVVPETAMSQAVAGSRDDLKVGETVFVFARAGEGKKVVAARVQVSKDGIKPTQ